MSTSLRFAGNPLKRSSIYQHGEDFMKNALSNESTKLLITIGDPPKTKVLTQLNKDADGCRTTQVLYLSVSTALRLLSITNIDALLSDYLLVTLGCETSNDDINADHLWYFVLHQPIEKEQVLLAALADTTAGTQGSSVDGSHRSYNFSDGRALLFANASEADVAIAGQALAMISWHRENQFDGRCGMPTESIEHGVKRKTTTSLEGVPPVKKLYPRVDPVMIACVVSPDGRQCLLGKMKAMPKNFYSCLSGFIEPCESIQEAVGREVWEEAGVHVDVATVRIVDSQPWPIGRGGGCELMIGCMAQAKATHINITEEAVEDVRWFTLDECRQMLARSLSVSFQLGASESPFIPGPIAIAHHLIQRFIDESSKDL